MDIQQQKQYKILLLGDSCLDVYHYGLCERISPEAPIPILKETNLEIREGMAANVKKNLESFDLLIDFYTNKKIIKKHRYVDSKTKYQLLRVDEGENEVLEELNFLQLKNFNYDAVVISDYDKGFLRHDTCLKITQHFSNIPIFVDSKKKDLSCFKNSFIKVNIDEYNKIIKKDDSSNLIITLGSEGAMYNDNIYPTKKVDVYDVCGAGDIFLTSLVFFYLTTKNIEIAINNSNKLATHSVTKFGTYILEKNEIHDLCL